MTPPRRQGERSMCALSMRSLRSNQGALPYGHTFALFGATVSIASLLLLALLCHSKLFDRCELAGTPVGINNFEYKQRRLMRQRKHTAIEQEADGASVDSSTLPCEDLFKSAPTDISLNQSDYNRYICSYAQNCDGDWPSTILLPLFLCLGIDMHASMSDLLSDEPDSYSESNTNNIFRSSFFIYFILPPLILCYLYLLFRLLATTADSYFSPALETFSFEMGLPPRFAGATLLALGNGSPDLGSTINAILLWNESTTNNGNAINRKTAGGWTMSLGSLTGGGMFVGTVVSGLIVQSCNGIPCRGAFLRDVSMYALSILMVWHVLESQKVTRNDVWILLGMWLGYVALVLAADLYHRKVTLPRLHVEGKKRRESMKMEKLKRLSSRADTIDKLDTGEDVNENTPLIKFSSYGLETEEAITIYNESLSVNSLGRKPRLSVTDRFAMLMSNYDPASVKFGLSSLSSTVSNDDSASTITNVMNQIHSIRRTSIAVPIDAELFSSSCNVQKDTSYDEALAVHPERLFSFPEGLEEEESIVDEGKQRSCSIGMFVEAYQEVAYEAACYWQNRFVNESSKFERVGFLLELPITILRTLTIPVPCEDHYNRVIVALSTAISPCWILWYFDVSLNYKSFMFSTTICAIAFAVILFGGDEKLPLRAAVPLSLYGFFIATTWIDVIGNNLVGLLQFLGTICRIPAPILGVTVLAWGNSLGDLSANVAMARKGLGDMATTANFAGPSFNLLVGVGFGFLSLQNKIRSTTVYPVSLTQSLRIGFSFNTINCCLIILCAVICQWRLPYRYSYVFFALYVLFIAMSLMTLV